MSLVPLITWVPSRSQIDLNGTWKSIIDVYDIGVGASPFSDNPKWGFPADRGRHSPGRRAEYDFDSSPDIDVPGDWNTQDERFHFYEGSMWFRRRFDSPTRDGRRRFVYLDAANYLTTIYLNGTLVAEHEGGYGPFCAEVTTLLRGSDENSLVIRVNNTRRPDAVPTTHTDWFNYGGLTRGVRLLDVPASFVRDAVVQLDPDDPTQIIAEAWLDGDELEQTIEITIDGHPLGSMRSDGSGHACERFVAPGDLVRWAPGAPSLYDVEMTAETDRITDRIGFRTVSTEGATVLVNGAPTFLGGISLHDEALGEPARRIKSAPEAHELLKQAIDLGSSFVRLAHYQHNEHTVRACDELGLLAWCEVPVYWGIDWANEATYANAAAQLTELITRDRNRAAVIMWSVANETRHTPERTDFLGRLVAHARALDRTRLLTAALFAYPADGDFQSVVAGTSTSDWVIDDPLGEHLDVLGVNQYHGWYYGSFDAMAAMSWSTIYDKPLVVTEFGGGARRGLRGDLTESWTEDFQAEIYRHQFEMLDRIPFLAGTTPWILKDFRAPFRVLPGVQDGFNRKGLIDSEGHRKLAFDVVEAWNRRKNS